MVLNQICTMLLHVKATRNGNAKQTPETQLEFWVYLALPATANAARTSKCWESIIGCRRGKGDQPGSQRRPRGILPGTSGPGNDSAGTPAVRKWWY